MNTLEIDIETYSSADLAKTGVYRYAEAPDFTILLFGYSIDGSAVRVVDLAMGETVPAEVLLALEDECVIKSAHNASFERVCLSRFLGYPTGEYLSPYSWHCSMVWSAYMGLPLSLKGVGAVLGLDKQKMDEGKELIRYFCRPCTPTKANGCRTRNLPADAPDKWAAFKAYNLRDVEIEMQIQQKLARFPVPDTVWEEYHISEEINDRGIGVDMPFVRNAIAIDARSHHTLSTEMRDITSLDNPNSVVQMKAWLADNGLEVNSLGKKDVAALLKDCPSGLKEVLRLRQQLAKSSVKKYTAMENAVCADNRARGMFMFYGANRTGRFAGRLVQLQNLPQNHISDLAEARSLAAANDYEALEFLYEDIPDTLSQLIRTAFVPQNGSKFIVADFSAIEARVIAYLAGETWKSEAFAKGEDIYCATASQMFHVPVVKHGVNGELRQKGKIAELACIAEGQPVLTDKGLVSIENVTTDMRLWDGERWVTHDGVIFKGEREVITYEGLTATPDHLVWVEGQSEPIQFGVAAARSACLIQTGYGRRAIRLGKNHFTGKAVEQGNEPLLCTDAMYRLRQHSMAEPEQFNFRKIKRLSKLFATKADSSVARQALNCGEAEMRKPARPRISQLRSEGYTLSLSKCNAGGFVFNPRIRCSQPGDGNRPNRQQFRLCRGKHTIHNAFAEQSEQASYGFIRVQPTILALRTKCRNSKTILGTNSERNNPGCGNSCVREAKELAYHQRTARLYDIRNTGPHHRFTVSGKLVHNCGYGGSVGALKAMGALEMGLKESELQPIVNSWRTANPNIVRFWWDVDRAVKNCIKNKTTDKCHGIRFTYQSGFLFITLPSGRRLAYVKPRIGENRFGGESVTYEGIGGTKKWDRIESYGPKFVENIVQAMSRDILMYAMKALRRYSIVAHIHDELIIECDRTVSLTAVCEQMGCAPPWAKGLILRADGYECDFYKKD